MVKTGVYDSDMSRRKVVCLNRSRSPFCTILREYDYILLEINKRVNYIFPLRNNDHYHRIIRRYIEWDCEIIRELSLILIGIAKFDSAYEWQFNFGLARQ